MDKKQKEKYRKQDGQFMVMDKKNKRNGLGKQRKKGKFVHHWVKQITYKKTGIRGTVLM